MKLPDPEQFNFKEGIIGGDECILITPHNITCKWSEDNLHYRSIILRKRDGMVISRGFDKFFNHNEHPEINPFAYDKPFTAIEKMDGSLLCWSHHNGELIHRTRGTFNAESMANGHEIEFLKKKYPRFIEDVKTFDGSSYLTEWTTPNNVIVINDTSEPTLTLIGIINNADGTLISQSYLDWYAGEVGLDRPKTYHYKSLEECVADVKLWEGKEGVCLYSNANGRDDIRKVKGDWYISLHKMATGVKGIKQVLELFMASPRYMESVEFYEYVKSVIDFEVAEKCKEYIERICKAYRYYIENCSLIHKQVDVFVRPLETRKEQALEIMKYYCKCQSWKQKYAFSYLDNKLVDDKFVEKAMEIILEL